MDTDPYFQPVDTYIEGVITDSDEQDPNLHDENDAEDDIKQEQVNINDPTENITEIENDEPIIQQPPILGDISDEPNDNVRRTTRNPEPMTPYKPSMTGNKYAETTATTLNQTIHPDTHMKLNLGPSWDHVVHYAMTHLSMKAGLKKGEQKARKVSQTNYHSSICETPSDPSIPNHYPSLTMINS